MGRYFILRLFFGMFACLALIVFLPAQSARAGAQILNGQADYTFGKPITFRASLQSDATPVGALFFLRAEGIAETYSSDAKVISQNDLVFNFDLSFYPLRAFSKNEFWFSVTLADNSSITSPHFTFYYSDNRENWQTLDQGAFHLHWYQGDQAYAQTALDIAQRGWEKIHEILPFQPPQNIQIYSYADPAIMQATLNVADKDFIAGHADPDLNLMIISVPPGPEQRLTMEQRIPHELMHILLFQALGQGYYKLPVWLNEGLASISELNPNPDYQILIESAVKKGKLIPIQSLCQGFPLDISGAQLSYAEANYFTRYLYQQYGSDKLGSLLVSYTDGLSCERGTEVALGIPLDRLESAWRNPLVAEIIPHNPWTDLLPWFILTLVVLILPVGLTRLGSWHRARSVKISSDDQTGDSREPQQAL